MDLPSAINVVASVVTIIGTSLTISQALRHRPSADRKGERVSIGHPPEALYHGAAPRATSTRQGKWSALYTGVGYGVAMSIAITIVGLTGSWLLDISGWDQTPDPSLQQLALVILTLAALASPFIAAGLVPARRIGSVVSGFLAGGIVAVAFDVSSAAVSVQMSPWTTFADYMSEGVIPSLIGFAISAIFAFLGRWAYHRALLRGTAPMRSSVT